GSGAARLRFAFDGPGNQGRPRRGSEQGPRAARPVAHRRRDDHEASAVDPRNRAEFRERRCIKEPIPVVPTIHYQMGGIPTNIHGQVVGTLKGGYEEPVNGFYAVGECSCVSVHGANRLGTNSLLDLVVFGRAAGNHIIKHVKEIRDHKPLPADAADFALARLDKLDRSSSGEYTQNVANDIRSTMQKHAGVFRTSALLSEGVEKIRE